MTAFIGEVLLDTLAQRRSMHADNIIGVRVVLWWASKDFVANLLLVQDVVMVLVIAVLLVNFLVDLLYVALDPRLRTAS